MLHAAWDNSVPSQVHLFTVKLIEGMNKYTHKHTRTSYVVHPTCAPLSLLELPLPAAHGALPVGLLCPKPLHYAVKMELMPALTRHCHKDGEGGETEASHATTALGLEVYMALQCPLPLPQSHPPTNRTVVPRKLAVWTDTVKCNTTNATISVSCAPFPHSDSTPPGGHPKNRTWCEQRIMSYYKP